MMSDHQDLDDPDVPLQPAPEVLRAREQRQAGAFVPWARPRALATLLVALLMPALLLLFIEQVP